MKGPVVESENPVEAGFRKALDRHGYGFQYAVLGHLQDAARRGSSWTPAAPEFPVEVRGRDTRVDFILQHRRLSMFMVCECKRANPATANWCFARAEWPEGDRDWAVTMMPVVKRNPEGRTFAALRGFMHTDRAFQIALEVRTGERGSETGSGRGEIEEAATQVCRGLNGLAQFFEERTDILPKGQTATLVPVIFTTATLWTSPIDVGAADLLTGNLYTKQLELKQLGWLWLDYPQSRGIQHSIVHQSVQPGLTDIFYAEGVRRIAVINASGIEEFMSLQQWGRSWDVG